MTDPNEMRVDEPRGDRTPEWEVFLRSDESDPLRHVGSVSAATESIAYEQASTLFGADLHTLWLCPAGEVVRYTERDFGSPEAAGDGADRAAVKTDDAAAEAAETDDAEAAGGESP